MIKPRRLRRVRTQLLRRNAEHPRGPTLNNFSPLCSSGALRASSDKNALVGSTGRQNVFSRLHRPVRGIPSSEKTRTLRGYAAFSPPKEPSPVWAAARTWMCPHALTRPLLVRSTFLLRAPAAFPLSLTISIRPRSNGHATRPLFCIPAFEAAALLPPLLSSARVFSCLSPAVVRPSRSSLQTRRREDRSPVSSFSRHGLCLPPFPLASHESSSQKQKMPSGSAAFPRRLVFPSLPCVHVPRLPSPAPHLLCIPRRKRRQHRHAFVPQHLHTQKARLHDADGPLHCKKAPIRNQACIPG